MLVFFSYQTENKLVAAEISNFFKQLGLDTFMAHEDIDVSHEWQAVILEKLQQSDIFVAVLSAAYLKSPYCIQESGIAVQRKGKLTIIPLSIDGTTSPGFMGFLQSKRYEPGKDNSATLFAGLAKFDVGYAVDLLINRLLAARSFATAEKWFGILWPVLERTTDKQKIEVLEAAAKNNQFAAAWGCRNGLRQLYDQFKDRLDLASENYLSQVLT